MRIKEYLIKFGWVGSVIITLLALYCIGRFLFTTPAFNLIFLLFSPFIAYTFLNEGTKSERQFGITASFIVSIFCGLFIYYSNGKHEIFLEKLFLKGHTVSNQVLVEDDNGRESYETHYSYEVTPGQNKWVFNVIDYGLFILSFGIPLLNFRFLMKFEKDKKQRHV